jgi:hypothetical protein
MWNDTPFTRRLGIRYPIDVNDDDLAIGGAEPGEHHPRAYACRQASSVTALEGSGAAKYRNFAGLRTM